MHSHEDSACSLERLVGASCDLSTIKLRNEYTYVHVPNLPNKVLSERCSSYAIEENPFVESTIRHEYRTVFVLFLTKRTSDGNVQNVSFFIPRVVTNTFEPLRASASSACVAWMRACEVCPAFSTHSPRQTGDSCGSRARSIAARPRRDTQRSTHRAPTLLLPLQDELSRRRKVDSGSKRCGGAAGRSSR